MKASKTSRRKRASTRLGAPAPVNANVQLTPPHVEITGAESLEKNSADVPRLLKLADQALKSRANKAA